MKKLLFILVSLLICGSAAAQSKITGRVTDQLGCPLKGAIVQVEGKENLKTTTDKNGEYKITVPKNSTWLIYKYPGMAMVKVDITSRNGSSYDMVKDMIMRTQSDVQEMFGIQKPEDEKSKILYLVDGKVVSKELFDQIPQTEIKDVNVMKGISSAVVVNTKSGLKTNGVVTEVRGVKKSNDMVNPITTQVTTVTIDKRKDNPVQIQTEEKISITGDDDTSFGPVGVDTYKVGENTSVSVSTAMGTGKILSISKKSDANNKIQALVVVKDAEGKIYKVADINSIDVNTIKSMTVFKSSPAKDEFKKYGDTSEGVIYIELKDKIDETKK